MTLQLRLYVVSGAPNSIAARANLADALAGLGADAYALEVVDCAAEPQRANVMRPRHTRSTSSLIYSRARTRVRVLSSSRNDPGG